ncbi:unnamed protein product [Bursaphelenchus xylophilus]|uniref:(pine wood nematode) hypothetical protein n=1 Tax=Bursaphelenchus xylophilus TaxID=6326 RepID=A0A7I8WZ37_BURXY|nr:unnamed protein product [Bursaphelenchus xylophilus]CAG9102302.1 unnamed protein product [Bursaphelenchus xylophilus]
MPCGCGKPDCKCPEGQDCCQEGKCECCHKEECSEQKECCAKKECASGECAKSEHSECPAGGEAKCPVPEESHK